MIIYWTLLLRLPNRSHALLKFTKSPYRCYASHPSPNKSHSKIDMKKYPAANIRNFGIIAHIDHGKSTLSDRLMEFAAVYQQDLRHHNGHLNFPPYRIMPLKRKPERKGNISKNEKHAQVLDKLQVERERGITVKAQTVSLFYEYKGEQYLLNLIDTPGHVDFSYEVNRSLSACQGVLLLVDANQGVQAQTVANFNLAYGHELAIIPVLNKIDLKNANPDAVSVQMNSLFGTAKEEMLKVSAKLGTGIDELIAAIIERIPAPSGDIDKPFRALLYDSWFSNFRGAVCMVVVIDGSVSVGDVITSHLTNNSYEVKEIGILYPDEISIKTLYAGQTGYVVANIRTLNEAKISDTWFLKGSSVESLPPVATSKPMVFAGIYPSDQSKYQDLRKSVEKLTLSDSSVSVAQETSPALGSGWRLGFLGLLHMEVFCQRLDQEFDAQVIVTAPSVPYKVRIKGEKNIKAYGGEEMIITNPLKFPEPEIIVESLEPMVLGTIITPDVYYSDIMKLCMSRRGVNKGSQNVDDHTAMLTYKFPLSEIIVDFFDDLKSVSSGFASFDYEEVGYESSNLAKVEILLNGKLVEELTVITHVSQARSIGRNICVRLQENINPHMFLIAIQAAVGGKVVARENIKALKKNVTAKLVEILLNGKLVEELTVITHVSQARSIGRNICVRLKENINPHMFLIAIQAAVGGKVVARANIKALKKNVTAKLYGGDVTRRIKLLQKQSAGKKRMRMIGNVEVPRDAFIKVLKR